MARKCNGSREEYKKEEREGRNVLTAHWADQSTFIVECKGQGCVKQKEERGKNERN